MDAQGFEKGYGIYLVELIVMAEVMKWGARKNGDLVAYRVSWRMPNKSNLEIQFSLQTKKILKIQVSL